MFRPSNGVWFTIRSAGGTTGTQWGNALDRARARRLRRRWQDRYRGLPPLERDLVHRELDAPVPSWAAHGGTGRTCPCLRIMTATAGPTSPCSVRRPARGSSSIPRAEPPRSPVGEQRRPAGARRLRRRWQGRYRRLPPVERHLVRHLLEHRHRRGRPMGERAGRDRAGRLRRRRRCRHCGVPAVERGLVHRQIDHRATSCPSNGETDSTSRCRAITTATGRPTSPSFVRRTAPGSSSTPARADLAGIQWGTAPTFRSSSVRDRRKIPWPDFS